MAKKPPEKNGEERWRWNDRLPLNGGTIVYIRRTNDHGQVNLLGHRFDVQSTWTHRLVRCEVNLDTLTIYFFALRRFEPNVQPLLNEVHYEPKQKWLTSRHPSIDTSLNRS